MTRARSILSSGWDWLILLLLLLPATVGMVLYGGVRLWVTGPLMWAVFIGGALFCLRGLIPGRRHSLRIPYGWPVLAAMGIYAAASIPGAAVPYEASLDFFKIVSYVVAYGAICSLSANRGRWQVVLGLILLMGSLDAWYAVVQHVKGSNLVLLEPRAEIYKMRASGTYVCPNHFAYLLALYVTVAAGLCFSASARWWLRILAAYTAILSLPVLLLTQSRSGWIAAIVGVGAVVLISASRDGIKRLAIAGIALALSVTVVVGGLWQFSSVFQQRVKDALRGNMRVLVWQDTLTMIEDEPVWGHGPGSYRWLYPGYKQAYATADLSPRYAHNEYLHMAAEYGLAGTGLFLGGLAVAGIRMLRRHRRLASADDALLLAAVVGCLAATAAHSMFDFQMHIFANFHILLVICAALLARLYVAGELPAWRWGFPVSAPVGIVGAMLLLALAVPLARRTGAYYYAEQARLLREDGMQLDRGLASVRHALDLDGGYWKTYTELGQILHLRSIYYFDRAERPRLAREAEAAFLQVLALNPYEIQTRQQLGQLYAGVLEEPESSVGQLREIVELAPTHAQHRLQLGLSLIRLGRDEEALPELERAAELSPRDPTIRTQLSALRRRLAAPDPTP